jgi:hypothetical protein
MGALDVPTGCVEAGGAAVTLGVTTSGGDRESYLRDDGTSARESLRLSFFASAGELERQFAVVEADDARDAPLVTMKWTPPATADVSEVRLVVVVRDLRGGVAFAERTLCVHGKEAR